jgi:hypothetical protein
VCDNARLPPRPFDSAGTAGVTDVDPFQGAPVLEFLNFILMFLAAWLIFRKPEKERLAFRLLVASVVLMVVLFSIATRTSLLPAVNY